MARVAVALVIWSSVLGACAADPDGKGSAVVAAGDSSTVPLSRRDGAMVVWDGSGLVVLGGRDARDDRLLLPLRDGARLDPSTGKWSSIPPMPIDPGLAFGSAVGTETEVFVIGTPCKDVSEPGDGVTTCEPGGYAAAALDTADLAWSDVELPAELRSMGGAVPAPLALGWTGSMVVVQVAQDLWTWAPERASWTKLPHPPFGFRAACLAGTRLVAVDYVDDVQLQESASASLRPGEMLIEAPEQAITATDRRVAATLLIEGDPNPTWSEPTRLDSDARVPIGIQAVCAGEHVLTLATSSSPGVGDYAFDPREGKWLPIPHPEPDPGFGALAVARDDGAVLLAPGLAVAYDETSSQWTALDGTPGNRPIAAAPNNETLFVLSGDGDLVVHGVDLPMTEQGP
jgi:hypothetical protein